MADGGWGLLMASMAWECGKDKFKMMVGGITDWWRGLGKDKRPMIVLGPGGTGKTTLGRMLSNEHDFLKHSDKKYAESWGKEVKKMEGSPSIEVIIAPGQQHRRPSTWTELLKGVAEGDYRGIILLSSYGYHSLGQISYKTHRLYKDSAEQFLADFLEENRADEISVLDLLSQPLTSNYKPMWLLPLVTKQDLWWPRRDEVTAHYQTGPYGKKLNAIVSQKDPKTFRCEPVFASLIINNFTTGAGEQLQQTAAGYDHDQQVQSLRNLFEAVRGLKEWELT